jgi:16S rRNA (guanine966-N2)-methyltransferase
MLDSSPEIIKALLENKTKLQVSNIDIIQASFPYSSAILKHRFDIVFLDPPFHQGYIPKALSWLEGTEILNIAALVYIESENEGELTLPPGWEFFRDKTSGNVRYSLIRPSIL